jgi:hypothetical protein
LIRIAITQAAFEAIAATLPLGSVSYDNAVNERGEHYVWLPPNVVERLRAQRRPGEYSDVILRVAATAEDVRLFQLHLVESGASLCNRNRIMTGVRFLFRVTLRRHDLAAEI